MFSRDIRVRLEEDLTSDRLLPVVRLLLITELRLLLFEFAFLPEEEERRDVAEERLPLLRNDDEDRLPLLRREDEERAPLEAIELREPEER